VKRLPLIAFLCAWGGLTVRAELTLPPLFTDNLVVQRDAPVPVWGQAVPGRRVTVHFAGQSKAAQADTAGHWRVTLDPLAASTEPRALEITEAVEREQSLTAAWRATNVLVGEVWLAAGQSNMEFPLARETHAATEVPAATNPLVRLCNFTYAGKSAGGQLYESAARSNLVAEHFFTGHWEPGSPASARPFSAVAYYFGRALQSDLHVPLGIIHCAVGGSPTEAWVGRDALARSPELAGMVRGDWLTNRLLDSWCRQRAGENLGLAPLVNTGPRDDLGWNHPFKPSFLWSAGPARFAPFALRGVLWYQGESNSLEADRVRQHEILFPLLVQEWRRAWDRPLPWLVCQLSSIRTNHYQSAGWPEFRDQQRRLAASVPDTGLVVTSDLGARDDVHPREKREVGRRLALVARRMVYGEPVESEGPAPAKARAEADSVTLGFLHATGLAPADGPTLRGFEIAGADGVFHPATATVTGAQIHLTAPGVPMPRRVRYGWQPFSEGNLVNAAGLPASTFAISVTQPAP